MIISHKHKFVFVHVPKTGGTSISAAFRPWLGRRDYYEILDAPKHFTARELRRAFFGSDLEWGSYLSFAVMRNPWERIHSDYCFSKWMAEATLGRCEPELEQWVQKMRRVSKYSFERFVHEEHLGRTEGTYQRYCQDGHGRDMVTFVGRFERLQQDWERVCALLRLPCRGLPRENRTISSAGGPRQDYRYSYTAQLRDLVAERFRDDIERFGYVF